MFICAVCLAYEPVAKILSDARQKSSTPAKIELTAGTRLEIPAKLKNVSEQILQRKGYTVSYNKDLKIPNWVAWELTPEKLVERESRTDKFLPDPDLPEHEAVTTDDYKGAVGWMPRRYWLTLKNVQAAVPVSQLFFASPKVGASFPATIWL